ncbi:MAG: sulfatase-like hydrolase/transferase [Myxococcota bacterium]|nr:sulfatase-like hydrolase/transferase [Myxococcota bacterium]
MSDTTTTTTTSGPPPENKRGGGLRKPIVIGIKLLISVAILAEIYRRTLQRDGADEIVGHLERLNWGWFALAVSMQLIAIGFGVVRWKRLLGGQGIQAPWSFLGTSWMIGRFWGAVTPGGLGLDGWRLYESAKHTGKIARVTALAGVEKVLGQLAFGVVVMIGSVFGLELIGLNGILIVNGFFVVLVAVGMTLLTNPQIFRGLTRALPAAVQLRVATLVEAVSAYRGKGALLTQAAFLGMGVHAFNNLIYVCAARALGVELSIGVVFFASSLQILSTLLPTSINGMGLREATAIALYTSPAIGLTMAQAVLIPTVGFAAEMAVSVCGALFFLTRHAGYTPKIVVEDPDRERMVLAEGAAPEHARMKIGRGVQIGLGAGLLAGAIVGIGEGLIVVAGGRTGWWVIAYGAVAYSLFCACVGAVLGGVVAYAERTMQRPALDEARLYARMTALLVAGIAFGLGAFRVRRDLYEEQLVWKSLEGIGVLLGCVAVAGIVYLALAAAIRFVVARKPGAVMLRAWGSPAVVGGFVAIVGVLTVMIGQPAEARQGRTRPEAPEGAGNVLVIVVDTMRADHLPGYGYQGGRTPNLDAFADDSIRFDQAFANASWTRPSFASIMTGRYPSSHGVMAKSDALPEELTTIGEAFGEAGWQTTGVVTNYNVGPYYHFDQGFDEFHYLEPEFVLWADDSAAKLLLVQFLRQRIEGARDWWEGGAPRGTVYQDAEVVNAELGRWLENAPREPWMMFVGYMDPHDPYYAHPARRGGYARAAHQTPSLAEADALRALYDGEITYWDEHFGRLIADLRARGLYDDMTIVVTSDHGEEFGEHGGFWHGTTLYDEQVRVPLYVKLPQGRRAGTTVRHWVQSVDIMPTLLAEAGIEIPEGVQGASLFEGSTRVYAEESHEGNVLESVRELRGTDELKLIVANEGNPRGVPARELFRVDLDPRETEDVSAEDPSGLEHTERAMSAMRIEAARGAVEAEEVVLDCEEVCQLCQLGYTSGQECERCHCG